MCDYSMEDVDSRPAKVGDQLEVTQFTVHTRGFAEVGNPGVAVCLLPGTELVFEGGDVRQDHPLGFYVSRTVENTARFRQVNPDKPHEHHDALEFPSGKIVRLTRLVAGQRATVLQLPMTESVVETVKEASGEAQSSALVEETV